MIGACAECGSIRECHCVSPRARGHKSTAKSRFTETQALIEEARKLHYDAVNTRGGSLGICAHCGSIWPCGIERLIAVLEAEMTARRDLTDKIEALAEKWDEMARVDHAPLSEYDHGSKTALSVALEGCAHELLGLVSGDKE